MNRLFSNLYARLTSTSNTLVERKNRIRQAMRLLLAQKKEEEKNQETLLLFQKIELWPEFMAAKTILLYWSTKNELPTHAFIEKWGDAKKILLPAVVGDSIVLKSYRKEMRQGALGIWEPDTAEQYEGEIDLVVVPGVAFDRKGNRLGRGRGFYDRFLAGRTATTIGIGFDFQIVDAVPANDEDMKMDFVVTPSLTFPKF